MKHFNSYHSVICIPQAGSYSLAGMDGALVIFLNQEIVIRKLNLGLITVDQYYRIQGALL